MYLAEQKLFPSPGIAPGNFLNPQTVLGSEIDVGGKLHALPADRIILTRWANEAEY
jgi:hypothetical protein